MEKGSSSRLEGLLELLRSQRSRRFGLGMYIPSGLLAFKSDQAPVSLSLQEEATMALAACGHTGAGLGNLCYSTGEGDNILASLHSRTIPSVVPRGGAH